MSKNCSKEANKGFVFPMLYTCKFSRSVSGYIRSRKRTALALIRNRKGHTMTTALFSVGELIFHASLTKRLPKFLTYM